MVFHKWVYKVEFNELCVNPTKYFLENIKMA